MNHERFEELKHSGKLPSPSGVGLRILMLTQNDDFSIEDIVQAVEADPALTGRLIRLASSAQGSALAPIGSAREAAVRLGTQSVCHLALGFSLVSGSREGRCKAFDYEHFWAFSLATAVAAQRIAAELDLGAPSEVFTLGLLHDIGRLALASVHPEEYEDVLRMDREDPTRGLREIENEHLFIDHRAVAAALLEEWGLPPYFIETVAHLDSVERPTHLEHTQTNDTLRVLGAAIAIADVCTTDSNRQLTLWPEMGAVSSALDVQPEDVSRVFDLVRPELEDWGKLMGVATKSVPPSAELQKRADIAVSQGAISPTKQNGRLRILAVDDDPVSLRLLVSLLQKGGHEVLTAKDGKEALQVYVEQGAQVVITDWMMPNMDGLLLCRQLRRTEEGRKLYILVLTGRTEEERIVEAFQAGVDDYIAKPFKPELLTARIQPAIRVIMLQEEHDRQVRAKERLNRQLDIERRKFKAAAMTDSLTELPNRRYAMKRLEKEWSNSLRSGSSFSVAMIDVDHFKRVNDQCGHDVGDVVLRATARSIQKVLRRGDTCARMGGEEFLVICPNTDTADGLLNVAERIRKAVENNVVKSSGFEGSVTVSVGAAVRTDAIGSIDVLLKMADEAVYQAKDAGRNQVVLASLPPADRKSA